jgi:hypothetical protein
MANDYPFQLRALAGELASDGDPAGSIVIKPGGNRVTHNRNIAAAATTHPGDGTNNVCTWTDAEGVRELEVSIIASTGAAIQNDEVALCVLDAPTDAFAKTWLEDAATPDADVEYQVLHYGAVNYLSADSNIRQFDILPLNVGCRVVVVAK